MPDSQRVEFELCPNYFGGRWRTRSASRSMNSVATDNFMKPAAVVQSDVVGKPFLVLGQGIRRCLVCEQLFTRREAPRHATVACYPRTCEGEKQ
jgi:hypothetical protein